MSTAGHALNGRFGLESSSTPFNALLEPRLDGAA